jgi:hypothetical protein
MLLTVGLAAFLVRQGEVEAVMARCSAGEAVAVVRLAVGVGFSPFSSGSMSTYSPRVPSQWWMRLVVGVLLRVDVPDGTGRQGCCSAAF